MTCLWQHKNATQHDLGSKKPIFLIVYLTGRTPNIQCGGLIFHENLLIQIRQRIYLTAIDHNLKMHMGSRASSCIAAQRNLLALGYLLA